MRLSSLFNVIALSAFGASSAIPSTPVALAPRATSTALCPTYNGQNYVDSTGATYAVTCSYSNNGAVIGSSSSTVNLGQCMTACDGASGCKAALFQTVVNQCYFVGTLGSTVANSTYNVGIKASTTTSRSTTSSTATSVAITFNALVTTAWQQSVLLVGSISQLGTWAPASGLAMSASGYTSSNPLWTVTVNLAPGTSFSYKYVTVNTDGSYSWEADPDRTYTVPSSAATESDKYQSLSSSSTTTTSTSAAKTTTTSTSTSSVKTTSTTSIASSTATSIAVTFNENVTTSWQQSVMLVGSISQLGTWTVSAGVAMSASGYTNTNPIWTATVNLPPGTTFQYKYVVIDVDNTDEWEADPNHSYTVPSSASTATRSDTWQTVAAQSTTSATLASTVTATVPGTTTTSVAATATCVNSATSRNCWSSGYDINTDFDTAWPNTGKTVSLTWSITNITLAPDGYSREVLAINGVYPGPRLEANWGDLISVTVTNNLPNNGTSIHWHGIRQYHNNGQDGVPGVTECPLAPGQTKTYTFQATQYGTSWYHSHFSSQYGDGILGPIVIHGPATANYDIDLGPLPITDWYYQPVMYHSSIAEHANALPPEADNGLINGTMTSNSGGQYYVTPLTTGKKHRIRIVNTAVDNHFVVSFDNHQMEVITSDFVPIVPYNTTSLFIGIGQRYDVIITANQTPGAYWFRADVQDTAGCGTNFNNGNIRSIMAYTGYTTVTPTSSEYSYTARCTDEQNLVPYWDSYVPQGSSGVQFTELTTAQLQQQNSDGSITLYWLVNGSALTANWETPTLEYIRTGNTNYPTTGNIIQLPTEGVWTYWVLQEVAGNPYDVAVPHPIHLHGHDFYVLGSGTDTWTAADANNLNYDNPPRRDVAMLNTNGWLALAFQTDNPGAWLMHCHIAWHADEGLALQFLESASTISSYASDFDSQCSAWTSYYGGSPAYKQTDSGI